MTDVLQMETDQVRSEVEIMVWCRIAQVSVLGVNKLCCVEIFEQV